jgi:glycosyltransferase involved in cell wall biosynthesis
MNGRQPLAIVVLAYKPDFIHQTIDSIVKQTCSDFTLYVFDDAGPSKLGEVAALFSGKIRLVYHRFDQNLGNKDLVSQWERCLAFVNEEWVWLFSDDDLMDKECVECFYQFIAQNKEARFVRFNTRIIDGENRIIQCNPSYPDHISSLNYLWGRLTHSLRSNAVEFVFKNKLLAEHRGFVNFPLGWCSDDATWAKLASTDRLYTITGACVSWRASGVNISVMNTPAYNKMKFEACMQFLSWLYRFLPSMGAAQYKWRRIQSKWLYSKLGHIDKMRRWSAYVGALERTEMYSNVTPIERGLHKLVWVELKIKGFIKGMMPGLFLRGKVPNQRKITE